MSQYNTPQTPQTRTARQPDYKADGIALWLNEKDGKRTVNVRIKGMTPLMGKEVAADKRKTYAKGGRTEDFRGFGLRVWFDTSKSGTPYANVRVVGCKPMPAFLNPDGGKPAAGARSASAPSAPAAPAAPELTAEAQSVLAHLRANAGFHKLDAIGAAIGVADATTSVEQLLEAKLIVEGNLGSFQAAPAK